MAPLTDAVCAPDISISVAEAAALVWTAGAKIVVTLTPDGHEEQICVSTVETPVMETVLTRTPDGQVGQLCVTTTVVRATGDATLPEATAPFPEATAPLPVAFEVEAVAFRME